MIGEIGLLAGHQPLLAILGAGEVRDHARGRQRGEGECRGRLPVVRARHRHDRGAERRTGQLGLARCSSRWSASPVQESQRSGRSSRRGSDGPSSRSTRSSGRSSRPASMRTSRPGSPPTSSPRPSPRASSPRAAAWSWMRSTRSHPAREQWVHLAQRLGEPIKFIEVICSDPERAPQPGSRTGSESIPHHPAHLERRRAEPRGLRRVDPARAPRSRASRSTRSSRSASTSTGRSPSSSLRCCLLLPPSETKRDGGIGGSTLDLRGARVPRTRAAREGPRSPRCARCRERRPRHRARSGSGRRSASRSTATVPSRTSPVLPAIDRYTGVLYDALGRRDPDAGRARVRGGARRHPLRAVRARAAPATRSRRTGCRTTPGCRGCRCGKLWAGPIAARAGGAARSGARPALGVVRAPRSGAGVAWYVRVVSAVGGRALNHFNKHGKGEFARAVIEAGIDHPTSSRCWPGRPTAASRLRRDERELELVVCRVLQVRSGCVCGSRACRACSTSGQARQQPSTWSSTMPADCMSAYIVVGSDEPEAERSQRLAHRGRLRGDRGDVGEVRGRDVRGGGAKRPHQTRRRRRDRRS